MGTQNPRVQVLPAGTRSPKVQLEIHTAMSTTVKQQHTLQALAMLVATAQKARFPFRAVQAPRQAPPTLQTTQHHTVKKCRTSNRLSPHRLLHSELEA